MTPNKVLLIGVGGAIGAQPTDSGSLRPTPLSRERVLGAIPDIERIAPLDVVDLFAIDSVNLSRAHWQELAKTIHAKHRDYRGIVVSHGLDTLPYTSAALSLMLRNLPLPIVLTGALNPIDFVSSDGRANLSQAVKVAAEADLGEVCVVSGNKIYRGNRVKKTEQNNLSALTSIHTQPLGHIGQTIELETSAKPRQSGQLRVAFEICRDVEFMISSPNFRADLYLDNPNWKPEGVVMLGYGSGCLPTEGKANVLPLIEHCSSLNIPFVVTTQATFGSSWTSVHEVGHQIVEMGAISAHDMTYETTLVKLMWVLAQTKDLKEVRHMMVSNYAGEITPPIMEDADDYFGARDE